MEGLGIVVAVVSMIAGIASAAFAYIQLKHIRASSLRDYDKSKGRPFGNLGVSHDDIERVVNLRNIRGAVLAIAFLALLISALWLIPLLPGVDVNPGKVWVAAVFPSVFFGLPLVLSVYSLLVKMAGREKVDSNPLFNIPELVIVTLTLVGALVLTLSVTSWVFLGP